VAIADYPAGHVAACPGIYFGGIVMSENRTRRPGSVVWPLLLISLGLVFLLNNLGVISWNVWNVMWRMWPVVLVAIGLDLIFGRRSGIGAAITALVILGMFAGAFWLVNFTGDIWGGDQVLESISQPLGDISQAEVDISMDVGLLEISALPDSSDLLIKGEIQVSEFEELREKLRTSGDTLDYSLSTLGQAYHPNWLFSNQVDEDKEWLLYLNPGVPLELRVDTGVGKSVLDLTGMTINSLDIDSGVGEILVILPAQGSFEVRVSGGVGKLEIQLPEGLAARISVDTGLGNTSVVGDFIQRGGDYYTGNYNGAEETVEIFLDGGVGNIRVVEIKP
jgi:hypothetical protein